MATPDLRALFDELRQHDSAFWRKAIQAGVSRGPEAWVRYSPPVFGLLFAAVLRGKRHLVRRNLRLSTNSRRGLGEHMDVARVFTSYASCMTEAFVCAGEQGRSKLVSHCPHDDRYVRAIELGRGVIVATAHTGGWQIAGHILRTMHPEQDVIVVMRRERDQDAQAVSDQVHGRSGVRVVHIGDDPLDALTLLGHLRRRGVVAVQIDRLPEGVRGRSVKLFGEPACVPDGPLRLASATGAPIVPVFTRRLGFLEYEVHVAEPIMVPRRAPEAELDRAAQCLADEVQAFIADNPTQWFHFE